MSKKITQEEFITRVKEIHGDRYGLEKAIYVDVKTPVILHCYKHGDFPITPDKIFYAKQGCGKCAGKGLTTEDFIKEARAVHGDRYIYSKTVYTKAHNNVIITCREHGDFKMSPYNHVKLGCNCQECSGQAPWTKELLIKRGREKYGNRFDYSMSDVNGKDGVIKIKCNICGTVFESTPHYHIGGLQGGCPTCRYKFVADAERVPFTEFVLRAKAKHGDKYTYHEESYTNFTDKTVITCPIHGDWKQQALAFVNGVGCEYCFRQALSESMKLDTDTYKQRVIDVYGDKFDLTDTIYKGYNQDVIIRCKECGRTFKQQANNFLRGYGCSLCNTSAGETKIKDFLLINKFEFVQQKRFKNNYSFCKNIHFFLDFFLPQENIAIEFNGGQHYRPVKWFGGQEKFIEQQQRDESVRQHCKDHNIKLIEIPYTEFDNIEEILTKELNIAKKSCE